MSSSKIFKADSSFVPITLVSEEILPDVPAPVVAEDEVQPDPPPVEDEPYETTQPPEPEIPEPPPEEPAVDLEAIRNEAYQQGRTDAMQELGASFHTAVDALARACEEMQDLHQRLKEESRGNLINTVMALTRKIVHRELRTDRETVVAILQSALDHTLESSECIITVHPDDLALVRQQEPELLERIRTLEHIVFKPDAGMEPGGCRVESRTCRVEASIEGQLAAARSFLEENLREEDDDHLMLQQTDTD